MNEFFCSYKLNKPIFSNGQNKKISADMKIVFRSDNFVFYIPSQGGDDSSCAEIYEDNAVFIWFVGLISNTDDFKSSEKKYPRLIAELYFEYQYGFINKLKGSFAFIIFDKKSRRLIVHKDRIGAMPLFYAKKNNQIFIAGSPAMILNNSPIIKELNFGFIGSYFLLDGLSTGLETEYKNINSLLPGQMLVLSGREEKKYKIAYEEIDIANFSEVELESRYYEIIKNSIEQAAPKKDAVIALSGGLDTNLIAAVLKQAGKNLNAFTINYKTNSRSKNEDYKLAGLRAEKYGANHKSVPVDSQLFLNDIKNDLTGFDRLFNLNNINFYYLAKKNPFNPEAYITGDGTEEQLSFYSYHSFPYFATMMLSHIPSSNQKRFFPFIYEAYRDLFITRSWEWKDKINEKKLFNDLIGRQIAKKFKFSSNALMKQCLADSSVTIGAEDSNAFNLALGVDFFNNFCSKFFTAKYLINKNLGINPTSPFINEDFVFFNARLPMDKKINYDMEKGMINKLLYRRAAAKILTDAEAYTNFKSGSDIPFTEWLIELNFEKYVKEILSNKNVRKNYLLNNEYVARILGEHYKNKNLKKIKRMHGTEIFVKEGFDHTQKILKLISFQLWWEKNIA